MIKANDRSACNNLSYFIFRIDQSIIISWVHVFAHLGTPSRIKLIWRIDILLILCDSLYLRIFPSNRLYGADVLVFRAYPSLAQVQLRAKMLLRNGRLGN